jgi:hypothetical protein
MDRRMASNWLVTDGSALAVDFLPDFLGAGDVLVGCVCAAQTSPANSVRTHRATQLFFISSPEKKASSPPTWTVQPKLNQSKILDLYREAIERLLTTDEQAVN